MHGLIEHSKQKIENRSDIIQYTILSCQTQKGSCNIVVLYTQKKRSWDTDTSNQPWHDCTTSCHTARDEGLPAPEPSASCLATTRMALQNNHRKSQIASTLPTKRKRYSRSITTGGISKSLKYILPSNLSSQNFVCRRWVRCCQKSPIERRVLRSVGRS